LKPGYKILIAIAIVSVGYHYYSKNKEMKNSYIKDVNKILTDIRREDLFEIQNKLVPKLSKELALEDIKKFAQDLNLTKESKFILSDVDKDKNITTIKGKVAINKQELLLLIKYQDINGTNYILQEKIGNRELKLKKELNLLIRAGRD
jgi:DNA replication protein DnaD